MAAAWAIRRDKASIPTILRSEREKKNRGKPKRNQTNLLDYQQLCSLYHTNYMEKPIFNPVFMPFVDRKKKPHWKRHWTSWKTSWRLSLSWVVKSNFLFSSLRLTCLPFVEVDWEGARCYPSCQFTQFHNRLARVLYFVSFAGWSCNLDNDRLPPKKNKAPNFFFYFYWRSGIARRHLRALPVWWKKQKK